MSFLRGGCICYFLCGVAVAVVTVRFPFASLIHIDLTPLEYADLALRADNRARAMAYLSDMQSLRSGWSRIRAFNSANPDAVYVLIAFLMAIIGVAAIADPPPDGDYRHPDGLLTGICSRWRGTHFSGSPMAAACACSTVWASSDSARAEL